MNFEKGIDMNRLVFRKLILVVDGWEGGPNGDKEPS